ncbi:DNA polymerase III subunit delta [Buchnera aphidicola (Mindarus abietinus)]
MKKIYLNKINFISKKNFFYYYFLIGNEFSLLDEAKEKIFKISKEKNFLEKKIFFISSKFNWDEVFLLLKNENIFNIKTIIILIIKDEKKIFTLDKNLKKIFTLLTKKNIIIIQSKNFSISRNNRIPSNKKKITGILIFCYFLNKSDKKLWIKEKLRINNINFSKNIKKNYENNLCLLKKKIDNSKFFNLKNKKDSFDKINSLLINQKKINPIELNNAILNGNKKKSIQIINKLLSEEYSPILLIRSFQKDLLILVKFYFQDKKITSFLKKENINSHRLIYFSNYLKKNDIKKLYFSIKLLTEIEIDIKNNHKKFFIWSKLQYLSIFLS